MYVNSANWQDCQKYFSQCYVKFKEEGDRIFYITRVDAQLIIAESTSGDEIGIDLAKGYTIEYVIPKKTVFQIGEAALFLSRIPARMWKKGMNKSNTQFQYLTEDQWASAPFDIHSIEGFVNKPSYYTAVDALNDFKNSAHLKSAALTPRISINHSGKIYLDTVLIGKLDIDKSTIISRKIFKPELTSVFKNMEIKVFK
jgi:hypothetical protein